VALTPDQQVRVTNILRMKLTEPCPLCLTKNWQFGENLVMLETLPSPPPRHRSTTLLSTWATSSGGPLYRPRPSPSYPTLPVMCQNCGNTVLLNVYKLGIADLWQGQIPATPQGS